MIGMTRRRLDWLLRAYGTDMGGWPLPERRAALLLLRRSRAARWVVADAMAREGAPDLDEQTMRRMQHTLHRSLAPQPAVMRGIGWSALAACAAAGLYLGVTVTETDPAPDLFTSAQTVLFASLDQ